MCITTDLALGTLAPDRLLPNARYSGFRSLEDSGFCQFFPVCDLVVQLLTRCLTFPPFLSLAGITERLNVYCRCFAVAVRTWYVVRAVPLQWSECLTGVFHHSDSQSISQTSPRMADASCQGFGIAQGKSQLHWAC